MVFSNLEIIFVDDCSTDNSGIIIDKYAKKYDNVLSFHQIFSKDFLIKNNIKFLEGVSVQDLIFNLDAFF